MRVVDLTQTIEQGMPVHHTQPEVKITAWSVHPSDPKLINGQYLTLGEHTGTHVDALSHMLPQKDLPSIDEMPIENFMGKATCIDLSHLETGEFITLEEVKQSLDSAEVEISTLDILLLHTDHLRKTMGTSAVFNGPGLTIEAAQWICTLGIRAFGIDTLAPGLKGKSNKEVHEVCGKTKVTHYEGLANLHLVVGQTFKFIGLPLKIKSGTGSPVRAIAMFD